MVDEVEQQREWHRRARAGDRAALAALYASMLPLLKSRVRRVLARGERSWDGWYGADDVVQDAFLVFHGFVMSCDPDQPLYRLLAGAFERALAGYLARRARRTGSCALDPDASPAAHPDSGYERACAEALLAALPDPEDRAIAALLACGWSPVEIGRVIGRSAATVRFRRRRMRVALRER